MVSSFRMNFRFSVISYFFNFIVLQVATYDYGADSIKLNKSKYLHVIQDDYFNTQEPFLE